MVYLFLGLLASQAFGFTFDFYYNFWISPAGNPCAGCPTSPTTGGFFGTCIDSSGTYAPSSYSWNLGFNVTNTPEAGLFNISYYGGPSTSGGCHSNVFVNYLPATCTTCWGYLNLTPVPKVWLCFQVVNQSSCHSGPRPLVPSSPAPPKPQNGRYIEEHYEKSSSNEKYDRVESGGNGGGGNGESPDAVWASHLPENLRAYFTTSQAAALPQPVAASSPVLYFLMALTFGVVIGVGSYMAKRVQKRSEYMPIKETADKDSLLFS